MSKKSGRKKAGSLWHSFCYCMALAWRASGFYTCLQMISRTGVAMVPVVIAWNTGCLVDLLGNSGDVDHPEGKFMLYMAVMLVLYLLRLLFSKLGTYASGMQQDLLLRRIEQEMAQTAVEMKLEYFDNPAYYDAFEAVKRDMYSVVSAVYDIIAGISYLISACSCVFLLNSYAPVYTWIVILVSVPVAVSERTYTRKVYMWGLEHVREERQMNYLYRTATERVHAQEVRLYGIGDYLIDKYQRLWNTFFDQKKAVVRKRAVMNLLCSILPELICISALFHVGKNVLNGISSVGDFTLYSSLLTQLVGNLSILTGSVMGLYEKKLKIDHLINFRKMVSEKLKTGGCLLEGQVDIEFRKVSFRYPGTERYVLKDVSFSLPQGKRICMVGENGAGKTTLLKLLLRFYEPDAGEILINGRRIQSYDMDSLRARFSCFFQNACNFSFSIKENIRVSQIYKDPEKVDKDQKRAERLSGTDELIEQFPDGEDTFLTRAYCEEGMELSGGQNQKVALARMFYRDASVLVLDEPSAALDPKAEYELFRMLREECGEQSMLFVSHRLSNVSLADEIIVMRDGCILAKGTHEELIKSCEVYQRLYHYQADKYVAKGELAKNHESGGD